MTSTQQRATLHVEGVDDQHTILHLLERHGLLAQYEKDSGVWYIDGGPAFHKWGDVTKLLNGMADAIRLGNRLPMGFVLDADEAGFGAGLAARWQSVSDRLRNLGAVLPPQPPTEGLILDVTQYNTRVGVWLMPDNQRDGALEDFLRELINKSDGRIAYALRAVRHAKKLGAPFPDVALKKAHLHTWLAWQKKPGVPYGTAIHNTWFGHDSSAALSFVVWFKSLYGIA